MSDVRGVKFKKIPVTFVDYLVKDASSILFFSFFYCLNIFLFYIEEIEIPKIMFVIPGLFLALEYSIWIAIKPVKEIYEL